MPGNLMLVANEHMFTNTATLLFLVPLFTLVLDRFLDVISSLFGFVDRCLCSLFVSLLPEEKAESITITTEEDKRTISLRYSSF